MPKGPRFAAAVVACSLLAVALLWFLASGETRPAAGAAAGPTMVVPDPMAVPTADGVDRDAVPAPPPAVARPLAVTVHGRCLGDESGEPVVATLWIGADDGAPLGERGTASSLAMATANDDGSFRFVVPFAKATDLRLHVEAPGRAAAGARRADVAPGSEWDIGEIRLVRAARVRGEVVDATGAQVAAAEVMLVMLGQPLPAVAFRDVHTTVTDETGAFTFPATIAAGEWYVRVERTGGLRTPRKTQVPGEGEHVVRIEVERPDPAFAIRGQVVDRVGTPLAGIELAAYGEGARGSAVSAADGTFVLPKGPPHFDRGQIGVEVQARGEGLEQQSPTKAQTVAWGQRDVRVVMRPLAAVVVRAIDMRGAAVWPFTVALGRLSPDGTSWRPLPASRQRVFADHIVLQDLASGAHALLLVPEDAALALAGPVPFVVDEALPRELLVRVPDPVHVRVDVVDAGGSPVPGCRLDLTASLTANAPDPEEPARDVAAARATGGAPQRQLALAMATTDADGRATLVAPPGSWLLRAACTTHLPEARMVQVTNGAAHHRLVLTAATVVRGTLVPASALPALGLHETKAERRLAVTASAGVNEVARAFVAVDGTFELGPLPRGLSTLRLAGWLAASDVYGGVVRHALGEVDGTAGPPIERTFEVSAFAPATATGVVVFDGAPLRNGQFFLRRLLPEPVHTVRVALDDEGRFRTLVPPGTFGPMLAIPSDPGPGHVILPMAERWSVAAAGSIELRIEASTRRLRLRLLRPDGAPLANARVQIGSGDGYNRPGSLQLDAQGRVDVALAPYGGFRVQAKGAAGVDLAAEVGGIDAGAAEGVVDVPLAPRSP